MSKPYIEDNKKVIMYGMYDNQFIYPIIVYKSKKSLLINNKNLIYIKFILKSIFLVLLIYRFCEF